MNAEETAAKNKGNTGPVATNRKALRDYFVLETREAGLVLRGTEVKSLRAGLASLEGSFARIEDGELVVNGMHIQPYSHGNQFNHEPLRPRKLLLHRREIARLAGQLALKGHTLVPLKIYFLRGHAKMELGVCRGKQDADKRETLRRKTADREAERAMARHQRR